MNIFDVLIMVIGSVIVGLVGALAWREGFCHGVQFKEAEGREKDYTEKDVAKFIQRIILRKLGIK